MSEILIRITAPIAMTALQRSNGWTGLRYRDAKTPHWMIERCSWVWGVSKSNNLKCLKSLDRQLPSKSCSPPSPDSAPWQLPTDSMLYLYWFSPFEIVMWARWLWWKERLQTSYSHRSCSAHLYGNKRSEMRKSETMTTWQTILPVLSFFQFIFPDFLTCQKGTFWQNHRRWKSSRTSYSHL
jgi:hypothetical protein